MFMGSFSGVVLSDVEQKLRIAQICVGRILVTFWVYKT